MEWSSRTVASDVYESFLNSDVNVALVYSCVNTNLGDVVPGDQLSVSPVYHIAPPCGDARVDFPHRGRILI